MSDPTTPPNDNERMKNVSEETTPELDSKPIDVNELLESTRKLFEPEELHRSLEQAGYTPEPSDSTPDEQGRDAAEPDGVAQLDTAARGETEPDTNSGDQEIDDEETGGAGDNPVEPNAHNNTADADAINEPSDGLAVAEEPQLKGLNVLSIVALILALALSPLAVIFGFIALGQTRRAKQRGETLALWAIGLGWIVFAAWVVVISSLLWIGYQQGITVESLREFIELFSLP